jgi:hypothetical protein
MHELFLCGSAVKNKTKGGVDVGWRHECTNCFSAALRLKTSRFGAEMESIATNARIISLRLCG